MSRYTTVRCDGPHCLTSGTSPERAVAAGWTVDERGRDLCDRCSKGKCGGEVGPYDCSCLLELDHEGRCACQHTFAESGRTS